MTQKSNRGRPSSSPTTRLAALIRAARDGRTIRQLSESTGIPQPRLRDYEAGRSTPPPTAVAAIVESSTAPHDTLVELLRASGLIGAASSGRAVSIVAVIRAARYLPDDRLATLAVDVSRVASGSPGQPAVSDADAAGQPGPSREPGDE